MDRNNDQQHEQGQSGLNVHQPIDMLLRDHHMVRQLFERYTGSDDLNVKQEAGRQILMLLESHSKLEETVFYPRVHEIDPSLVDTAQKEHQQLDTMLEQLKGMNLNDPQCDQLFRQVGDMLLPHLDEEEQQLFPKVQQSRINMKMLGAEMMNFESSLASAQAKA